MRQQRDLTAALLESLEQLNLANRSYAGGTESSYQGVAIQLRKLLLGGRRGLLGRVVTDPTFHPLPGIREIKPSVPLPFDLTDAANNSVFFDFAGGLQLRTNGPPRLYLRFLRDAPVLPIEAWLRQSVVSSDITIKKLISECAGETAAHASDEVAPVEKWGASVRFGGEAAGNRQLHRMALVAVGEYVNERCIELLGGPIHLE